MNEIKDEKKGLEKYEIENALNDLIRVHEIYENKELMAAVQKLAIKKKKAISSISDIRAASEEMAKETLEKEKEEA